MISTKYLKKRKSRVQHIDYELQSSTEVIKDINSISSGKEALSLLGYLSTGKHILELEYDSCMDLLQDNKTRSAIVEADLIVTLSVMICGTYIASIYDKPFVVVHPGPTALVGSFAQVPLPPSYVPMVGTTASEKMNFLQRTQNFVKSNFKDFVIDVLVTSYFRSLQEKFGRKSLERFSHLFGKAELYIVTVDFAFEFVHPTMPGNALLYIL